MSRLFFLYLFLFVNLAAFAQSKFVVVIDAGHGGRDGGAARGTYKEKDINLSVAKKFGELIESNYKDVEIIYTRKTDVFINLDKRAQIANKAKANLFVSIHTNSTKAKATTAYGVSTYILGLAKNKEGLEAAKRENSVILLEDNYKTRYAGYDPNSPESHILFGFMSDKYMEQSLQFADLIQKDFKGIAKRSDRGVRQADFLVLRETGMPSVLIELGFINNSEEAKYLGSSSGQTAMAKAIFSGFKKYKQDFDRKQAVKIVKQTGTNLASSSLNDKTASVKGSEGDGGLEYRIQFLVSSEKISPKSKHFKGLSPVKYYNDGEVYKYTYGSTNCRNEIVEMQKQVRGKFKDAFVIRMKNGERVQ